MVRGGTKSRRTKSRRGKSMVLAIALGSVVAACSSSPDSRLQPAPAAETTTIGSTLEGTTPPTTTAAEPAPNSARADRFQMLPPGSALPSDEECAARVRPTPEIRPRNTQYNRTPGSGPPKNPPSAIYQRVTGRF